MTIPLLTSLALAAIYPLCFWISDKDPLKNDFHKFHLGMPNCVGGVAVVALFFMNVPLCLKIAAVIWKVVFLFISYYYWRKGNVNPKVIAIPCLMGMVVFLFAQRYLIILPLSAYLQSVQAINAPAIIFSGILGGFIFCLSLYTMNLGHWYLNVHGLPIIHLKKAVYVFWFFLITRALWDIYAVFTMPAFSRGEMIPLFRFLGSMEGFFLNIAFFFGTLFPIVSLWFVKGTLEVKSTQSATGILYVILSAILIGDITYKYYVIRYGLGL